MTELLDERHTELKKLMDYAEEEQGITNFGVDYQKAALDLGIAARQMMVAITKYKLERRKK